VVVLAETRILSGAAALVVATEPIFVVVLSRKRPSPPELAGMALSTVGLLLLVGVPGAPAADPLGLALVLLGCVGWALASVWVPRADLPRSPPLAAGLEMLAGGAALLLAGLAHGERFDASRASGHSLLAMAYLVFAGSIVAFSAYQVLARSAAPALVATYAYINPVVAVLAGILLGGEPASLGLGLASAAIVGGVVLITAGPALLRRRPPGPSGSPIPSANADAP
jgi:drug/metabolite transporter (DMT)-like permease